MFWNKQKEEHLNSSEYESVVKKLVEFSSRIEMMSAQIEKIEIMVRELRGKYMSLRKLDREEEETQNIKTGEKYL